MLVPKGLLLPHSTTKAVEDADFCTLILQLKRELMLLSVGIGTACSGYCLIMLSVQVISSQEIKAQYLKFKKFLISDPSLASLIEADPSLASLIEVWNFALCYFAERYDWK